MSKQEEIKQALSAATPGPWKVYRSNIGRHEETLIGTEYVHPQLKSPDSIVGHAYGFDGQHVYIRAEDAELIAKAPGYIAYLLETLEEVLLDRDIAKQNRKQWEKCYDAAEENSGRLRKELEKAEVIIRAVRGIANQPIGVFGEDFGWEFHYNSLKNGLKKVVGQEGEGNQDVTTS